MNYGYPKTKNDAKLAADLTALLAGDEYVDERGQKPYVERNGLYEGVRIRRITHLSDEQQQKLVAAADAIFARYEKGGK